MTDKHLEKKCTELLGWSDYKISRSRPMDIQAALKEYSQTAASVTVKIHESPVVPSEKKQEQVLIKTPIKTNIIQFQRSLKKDYKSMPIITPFDSTKGVSTNFFVESDINDILINSDVTKLHEHVKFCFSKIERFVKRKEDKTNLLAQKENKLDLYENELLQNALSNDNRRLNRYKSRILFVKNEVETSLKRKNILLDILTSDAAEDSEDDEVNVTATNQQKLLKRISDLNNILKLILD